MVPNACLSSAGRLARPIVNYMCALVCMQRVTRTVFRRARWRRLVRRSSKSEAEAATRHLAEHDGG